MARAQLFGVLAWLPVLTGLSGPGLSCKCSLMLFCC